MILAPDERERFYAIWWPLLRFVDDQTGAGKGQKWSPGRVPAETAFPIRAALWADDSLLERYAKENPAGLAQADCQTALGWKRRVQGTFMVYRHARRHCIMMGPESPPRFYGVLGLTNPIAEVVGPGVPTLVKTVLLPFEGKVIYDGLMEPYPVVIGPGIRRQAAESYRHALEREGVVTSWQPPGATPKDVAARNARLLDAYRAHLYQAGLSTTTVNRDIETLDSFAHFMIDNEVPKLLLHASGDDWRRWQAGGSSGAQTRTRFTRFLESTGRVSQ